MKRKRLTKAERQQVYEKYNGRCGYCGKHIELKDMQVDHIIAIRNGGCSGKAGRNEAGGRRSWQK